MRAAPLQIELSLPAVWREIEPTRWALQACARIALRDSDAGYALAMAAAELLENAVKYGDPDGGELELEVTAGAKEARVCVRNSVAEGPSAVATLRGRIDWIESFATPRDAYLQALHEGRDALMRAEPTHTRGGLGLVRVASEADCKLRVWAESATRIAVEASRPATGKR